MRTCGQGHELACRTAVSSSNAAASSWSCSTSAGCSKQIYLRLSSSIEVHQTLMASGSSGTPCGERGRTLGRGTRTAEVRTLQRATQPQHSAVSF
jgi:hypothetical protein